MPWSLQTVGSIMYYIPNIIPGIVGTGSVTSGGGTIIMVGRGTNSIASYNIGTGTWSLPSTIFSSSGRSVVYGNQKYVAVGEGTNTIAVSNDGSTWTEISSPPFSGAGYDIVYAGSTWVAVGQGTNQIAYFDRSSWITINNGIGKDYTFKYAFNSTNVSGTSVSTLDGSFNATLMNSASINTTIYKYGSGSLYVNNTANWNASTTQYLKLPTFDLPAGGFTIGLWIYPLTNLQQVYIFDFATAAAINSNNMIFHINPNNKLNIFPNIQSNSTSYSTTGAVTANQWSHYCVTIDSAKIIKLYLNGALDTTAGPYPGTVSGTKTFTNLGSTYYPNVGFKGYIDDFVIYPRVLTDTEVSNLCNNAILSTKSVYGLYYDASVPRLWATGSGLNTIAYSSAASGTWAGSTIANMTQVNAISSIGVAGAMVNVGYGNSSALATYSTNYSSASPTFTNSTTTYANLSNGTNGGAAVAYGNGVFVWGGSSASASAGNSLAYSTNNGATWTGVTSSYSLSTYNYRIVFGNGKFYATGGGNVCTSTNGTSWSADSNANAKVTSTRACYYDITTNTWYIGGNNGAIAFSTDNGATWGNKTALNTGNILSVRGIARNPSTTILIATGFSPTVNDKIARSTDSGTSWTIIPNTTMSYGNDIKYNNGVWLLGGSYAAAILYKSIDDGSNWTQVLANTSVKMTSVNCMYNDGTKWYISGSGANYFQFAISTNNSPSSISDFTFITNNTMGGGDIAVSSSSLLYVAGGIGTNNLQRSSNGTTWSSVTSPFSVAVNDVKNNGSLWVAVGEGASHTIATSSDGTTWTGRGTTTFSIRGNKVRWNSAQGKWYAVGEGTNTLASSSDGITWTGISTTGYVDVSGIGLTFNI